MNELHAPWLEIAVLVPLLGSLAVRWARSAFTARTWTLVLLGISLVATIGDWIDFAQLHRFAAHDRWDLLHRLFGRDLLVVDELTAPLLALVALIGFLTVLATLRTKVDRFSYSGVLLGQALSLALLGTEEPWLIVALAGLTLLPPWLELRRRRKSTRVYTVHLGAHYLCLVAGWAWWSAQPTESWQLTAALALLVAAIWIRVGIAPLHCWLPELCEHATFGGAILFVTPMIGAYLAVRLLFPIGPEWAMRVLALAGVLTAVYAAGMGLVQRDARRFFACVFLSHSALVLVGLETVTSEALTGGLCVWFAAALSLAGFGLTIRSVESRMGRLGLTEFQGLYEHMPNLAILFLVTGLASVGFPGTIGFVATELLIDGVIHHDPFFGYALVVASALNGIAILAAYFRLFTGTRHRSSVALGARWGERAAVLTLVVLMIGGGLFPQPFLASRSHAASELLQKRTARPAHETPQHPPQAPHEEPLATEGEDEQASGEWLVGARAAGLASVGNRRPALNERWLEFGGQSDAAVARRRPRIRDATDEH